MLYFPYNPTLLGSSLLSKFDPHKDYEQDFYNELNGEIANRVRYTQQRAKYLREKNGLSMKELSDQINIKPPSLTQLEQGKIRPTINTVAKISTRLGTSLDYLVFGEEHVPVNLEEIIRKILALQNNPNIQMTIVGDEVRLNMKALPSAVALLKEYISHREQSAGDPTLLNTWLESQLMNLGFTEETESSESAEQQ